MKRRTFLKSLGLASGSLFLPSLLPRHALAQAAPPKRLIIFFTQHGTWHEGWKIHPEEKSYDGFWEMSLKGLSEEEFSPALRPLHAWRDRMVMVDGLGLVSAELDQSNLRHEKGEVHALTGANISMVSGVPLGSAPSIDQRIASALARPDRWKSLELGVGEPPLSVIYGGDKQILPYELSPENLYRRLFETTGLTGTTLGGTSSVGRGRVLERIREQTRLLQGRLSQEDAAKLEVHRGILETIETRVVGLSSLSCGEIPALPTELGSYEQDFQAFIPMITSALACDMTRVVSLHMGQLSKQEVLGVPGDLHDEHAHSVYVNPESADVMTKYTAVHAQHVADLLTALDSVPEGNGTLLDNTMVAWLGELGDGSHGFDRWPVVLFGGQGIAPGRVLHYPRETPVQGQAWDDSSFPGLPGYDTMGVPHQKLLTSICQAMGVEIDRMPVETLRGKNGETIDCTGILNELFQGGAG